MAAHPSAPEDGDFSYAEMLEAVRHQRMWAFVRIQSSGRRPAVLHWWAHRDVPEADIAEMIGHELGHLSDRILADDAAEERRADSYGAVARATVCFLRKSGGSRRSSSARSARRGSRAR
jgi:hypothetical protein